YFGYDVVRRIEKLPVRAMNDLGVRRLCGAAFAAMAAISGCGRDPAAGDAKGPAEAPAVVIRVATFNAYLNRAAEGGVIADLSTPDNAQARAVAEIIQRTAPDILLLQEIDFDADGRAVALFKENYLAVSQNGAAPAIYPYVYAGPVNTGVHSGHDLDRNGAVVSAPGVENYGGDAFGFGAFPGQFGMALLSKYPIDEAAVRSFQLFLWRDMPDAMLPDDPVTEEQGDWYSPAALAEFRLSSKSHWDIPVIIGGKAVHILAGHPTPPVFDGEEDRNGRRNHDEIRFWADYISPDRATYIYDDAGAPGGLTAGERFVIIGDMNADPNDGDGVAGAVGQLLDHPLVIEAPAPESRGAAEQASLQGGANLAQKGSPSADTADFGDDAEKGGPGNLRLDYVLASKSGIAVKASGVFWPATNDDGYALIGPGYPVVSSDHRLVWTDVEVSGK
ncbi:MAG: endonuclease/exonuclease/phosphatase family protein, partial [Parvularculaceae bacterium]